MSRLGDLIVQRPFAAGQSMPDGMTKALLVADELNDLRAELIEARDLRALFDLQYGRMHEATKLWRAEDPAARALVMPDLGALLEWLLNRIERLTVDRVCDVQRTPARSAVGSPFPLR